MVRLKHFLIALSATVLVIVAYSFFPTPNVAEVIFSSAGSDMAMFDFSYYDENGNLQLFSLVGNCSDTIMCKYNTPFSIAPFLPVPPGYRVSYYKQSIDSYSEENTNRCLVGIVGENHTAKGLMYVIKDE